MLVKTTERCHAHCNHCLEDATPTGAHMTDATFRATLDFTERTERAAWARGAPPQILLSGGECTDHPHLPEFIQQVVDRGWIPLLLTHGRWLDDPIKRQALLRPKWSHLFVQVTYDPRFYTQAPPRFDDPRVHYVETLSLLIPLGRITRHTKPHDIPWRLAPTSFNLRSFGRSLGSFSAAVVALRERAARGYSGNCVPSVSADGTVTAGETRFCAPLGTVHDDDATLTRALLALGSCNRCGLEDNLSTVHRRAIGLPPVRVGHTIP